MGRARTTTGAALLLAVLTLAPACAGVGADEAAAPASTGTTATAAPRPTTTTTARPSTTTTTAAPITTTTTAPPATTTTTAPPTTTTEPPPPPTTEPPPPPEAPVLEAGVSGPRTEALQERLRALGFDPGPADGDFGGMTTMAVWAYQAIAGHPKDGRVTPELEAEIMQAAPYGGARPDGGPDRTEVDLARQVLLVFRGGQLRLATHVSTGSGEDYCENGHCGTAITPTGTYAYNGRRYTGWHESYLGSLYNPVYFYGGYAVHGSTSVPPYPASHGCVRLPMHVAEYFPTIVETGQPVYIY
jgi:peptidoglycan hydrolase-like protein with peptidoglycan-binding domain